MKDSVRQKWQDGLSEFLEPGERVEAARSASGAPAAASNVTA
jgi:hypothetical protein